MTTTTNRVRPDRKTPESAAMPIRAASEVLRILEPRIPRPVAAIPKGLWKTGWLPGPQGASS